MTSGMCADRLESTQTSQGVPTNGEVLARIKELARSGEGGFETDSATAEIHFVVNPIIRIEVTLRGVKEALKGERKSGFGR
jgi:hypothetical protein